MRSLVYFVAVSLDGRIADPDGGFADFLAEGDHLAALAAEWSDTVPGHVRTALGMPPADGSRFDTVLMGWNTYAVGLAEGVDSPYPHLRQIVVSSRSPEVPADVEVVAEDPAAAVRALKGTDGNDIWLCGGGQLAATLADEIDRLVLKVNPVVFGDGIPLFAGGYRPTDFALVDTTAYASGVVVNDYQRRRQAR